MSGHHGVGLRPLHWADAAEGARDQARRARGSCGRVQDLQAVLGMLRRAGGFPSGETGGKDGF